MFTKEKKYKNSEIQKYAIILIHFEHVLTFIYFIIFDTFFVDNFGTFWKHVLLGF